MFFNRWAYEGNVMLKLRAKRQLTHNLPSMASNLEVWSGVGGGGLCFPVVEAKIWGLGHKALLPIKYRLQIFRLQHKPNNQSCTSSKLWVRKTSEGKTITSLLGILRLDKHVIGDVNSWSAFLDWIPFCGGSLNKNTYESAVHVPHVHCILVVWKPYKQWKSYVN